MKFEHQFLFTQVHSLMGVCERLILSANVRIALVVVFINQNILPFPPHGSAQKP